MEQHQGELARESAAPDLSVRPGAPALVHTTTPPTIACHRDGDVTDSVIAVASNIGTSSAHNEAN